MDINTNRHNGGGGEKGRKVKEFAFDLAVHYV